MAIDLNDRTVNMNHLTNSGATEVTSSLPFTLSSTAIDLESGSSQYLYSSDSSSLSITGNFTLECWVKFESFPSEGNNMAILSKANFTTSNRGYLFNILTDGGLTKFQAIINQTSNDTTRDVVRWTYALSTGTWYHVALVCTIANATATTFELFINGSSQGNGTAVVSGNCSSIYDNTASFRIGTTDDGLWFYDGVIDDVRVWNTVRTSTEITTNKSLHLTGSETGLVAYWPFEQILSSQYLKERYHNREDMGGYSLG